MTDLINYKQKQVGQKKKKKIKVLEKQMENIEAKSMRMMNRLNFTYDYGEADDYERAYNQLKNSVSSEMSDKINVEIHGSKKKKKLDYFEFISSFPGSKKHHKLIERIKKNHLEFLKTKKKNKINRTKFLRLEKEFQKLIDAHHDKKTLEPKLKKLYAKNKSLLKGSAFNFTMPNGQTLQFKSIVEQGLFTAKVSRKDHPMYTQTKKKTKSKYLSYVSVKNYLKRNGFSTKHDYQDLLWAQKHIKVQDMSKFPTNPEKAYKKEWTGWDDFLANPVSNILSYGECKNSIRLFNLNSRREFNMFQHVNLIKNIPTNPEKAYKKEWTGWDDFLGTAMFDTEMKKAYDLSDDGENSKALAIYNKILKKRPGYNKALYNKGYVLELLERERDAISCYEQVLKSEPNDVDALNNLGGCFLVIGKLAKAKQYFLKGLKIEPDSEDLQRNLLIYLMARGPKRKASTLLKKFLEKTPNDPILLEMQASNYIFNYEDYKAGLKLVNRLLKKDRTNAGFWHMKAICYYELGRSEEQVLDFLTVAINLDPEYIPDIKKDIKEKKFGFSESLESIIRAERLFK